MAFKETLLQEAFELFRSRGIKKLSKKDILKSLSISEATFDEYFTGKEDLLKQSILEDQKLSIEQENQIEQSAANPVDELLTLVEIGVEKLKITSKDYISDLVKHYPEAMELSFRHMNNYSYHKIYGILNKGVQQGLFRKDLNMEIVTRVMLSNITLMLNHEMFPIERYDLNEVFRSIYLYYVRGICTDSAFKYADKFFTAQE